MRSCFLTAAFAAAFMLPVAPALADAERLEADLRALFAGRGELSLGEVSTSLLGGETRAEEIRFTGHDGERLWVERYVVAGDYDAPDAVTLEGVRLEGDVEELEAPLTIAVEEVALDAPDRAVPPRDDEALEEAWFDGVTLTSLAIDHREERLARLERLALDNDFADGEGGLWLDALTLDLTRMIALSPEEERTRLRMASNVLTDGSGELRLDAAFDARWEPEDEREGRLVSDGELTLRDGLVFGLDLDSLLVLPEEGDVATLMAEGTLLEEAALGGGRLELRLAERGLFDRLATLGATMEGISKAQYLEQARTQAEGFGMMFGPQVRDLLNGLVDLMAGGAESLVVTLDLPAEERLERFAEDPLALPERFAMRVETR